MQTSLTRKKKKDKAHYDQQNIVSKPDKRVMVHNIIIGIPVSPRLVTKCPSNLCLFIVAKRLHFCSSGDNNWYATEMQNKSWISWHPVTYRYVLNALEKARHLGTKAKYNMITCYFQSIISTKVYQKFWYALVLIIQIRFSTEYILKNTDQILINDFWTLFSLIHRLQLSVTDGEMTRHGVRVGWWGVGVKGFSVCQHTLFSINDAASRITVIISCWCFNYII